MHQQPDHREPPGAFRAGDRAGGIQRGRGGSQFLPGSCRASASASAGRLFSGMERGVCTLAISLSL